VIICSSLIKFETLLVFFAAGLDFRDQPLLEGMDLLDVSLFLDLEGGESDFFDERVLKVFVFDIHGVDHVFVDV
jgi:hypothetical protein